MKKFLHSVSQPLRGRRTLCMSDILTLFCKWGTCNLYSAFPKKLKNCLTEIKNRKEQSGIYKLSTNNMNSRARKNYYKTCLFSLPRSLSCMSRLLDMCGEQEGWVALGHFSPHLMVIQSVHYCFVLQNHFE